MERQEAHEAELRGLDVEHLYLFGSTVRDEAGNNSDADLFFDYPKGKFGLEGVCRAELAAEQTRERKP